MVIGGESVATRIKNIREVGVLVQDTNQISAGAQGFDVLEDYKPRDEESMNLPAELRTEWLLINVSGSWEQNPRVYLRANGPYKAVVLALDPRLHPRRCRRPTGPPRNPTSTPTRPTPARPPRRNHP